MGVKVFHFMSGEVRDLPADDAKELVDTGQAEYVDDEPKKKASK
jgi:hypothetical protein